MNDTGSDAAVEHPELAKELLYLSDLIGFRQIISQNSQDADTTEPGTPKQFLYFADTNTLQLCFDPHNNSNLTRPFRFLAPSENRDAGISIITAEFLLAGHLPGRRGAPLFVTPAHWSEFTSQLERIIAAMTAARRSLDENRRDKLQKRISAIRDKIEDASEDVATLRRIYDDDVQTLFVDGNLDVFARPKMLAQLLKSGDLIRPMMQAPYIDIKLITEPDEVTLSFWRDRLNEVHSRRGTGRHHSRNTEADAGALATLQTVNADLVKRQVPVEAVLITGDRAILDATIRSAAAESYGFVRDLRQFIPLINHRDMSGPHGSIRPTEEVRLAIDAFLQQTSDDDGTTHGDFDTTAAEMNRGIRSFAQALLSIARMPRADREIRRRHEAVTRHFEEQAKELYGHLLGDTLDQTLKDVADKWNELIESSRRTHAGLIAAYYKNWLSEITETFEDLSAQTQRELSRSHDRETTELTRDLTKLHLESTLLSEFFAIGPASSRWGGIPAGFVISASSADDNPLARAAAKVVAGMVAGDWQESQNQTINLCSVDVEHPAYTSHACAAVAMQLGRLATAQSLARFTNDLISAERHFEQDAALELVDARAQFLDAVSQRMVRLQSSVEGATRYAAIRCRDTCRTVFEVMQSQDLPAEAALALAEAAAAQSTGLMIQCLEAKDPDPKALHAGLRDIVLDASRAIDLAASARSHMVTDVIGRSIVPVAQVRAATALTCGLIATDVLGVQAPSLAFSYLEESAELLSANGDTGIGGQSIARPLSRIALSMHSTLGTDRGFPEKEAEKIGSELELIFSSGVLHMALERELLFRFLNRETVG